MIQIHRTLREAPIRALIYGRDGVGKSTFCAAAPLPIFIAVESGLDYIDARAVDPPATWTGILDSVEYLIGVPDCESIVIDSLDWAESLCWAHVCDVGDDKGKKKNIEAFGYGKGYVAAVNEWRGLINVLSRAHGAGKHILLVAHAQRKSVKNPSGEDYEQWGVKLHEKAAGLWREWVDVVGYAELDIATVTDKDDGGRTKGIATGKRILRTQPAAGYESKSRAALPPKIDLTWSSFAEAVRASGPGAIAPLRAELETAMGDDQTMRDRVNVFLGRRGLNVAALREAVENVKRAKEEKKEG